MSRRMLLEPLRISDNDGISTARKLIQDLMAFKRGKPSSLQVEIHNAINAIEQWIEDYQRIKGQQ